MDGTATKVQKGQFFMIVRQGHVQRYDTEWRGERVRVWPIAENHVDAMRLCKLLEKIHGKRGLRPALIGSMEGETLEGHIRGAIEDGCIGMFCVDGWNADGHPTFKIQLYDEHMFTLDTGQE
jgi:hypothetical protein